MKRLVKSDTIQRKCDLCGTEAKYDAKLTLGGWGYVCETCFQEYAVKTKGSYTTLANIGKPGRKPYSD